MRYLTVGEVMEIYSRVMTQSGGSVGILDLGALESAVAQPRMTFNGKELYPTIFEKASALGFSLIQNHPFVPDSKPSLRRWQQADRSCGDGNVPDVEWIRDFRQRGRASGYHPRRCIWQDRPKRVHRLVAKSHR